MIFLGDGVWVVVHRSPKLRANQWRGGVSTAVSRNLLYLLTQGYPFQQTSTVYHTSGDMPL